MRTFRQQCRGLPQRCRGAAKRRDRQHPKTHIAQRCRCVMDKEVDRFRALSVLNVPLVGGNSESSSRRAVQRPVPNSGYDFPFPSSKHPLVFQCQIVYVCAAHDTNSFHSLAAAASRSMMRGMCETPLWPFVHGPWNVLLVRRFSLPHLPYLFNLRHSSTLLFYGA
jgi:hypothetical protein